MTTMKFSNFSYITDLTAPKWYKCDKCGCGGVQLFRDYNTFVSQNVILCAKCLAQRNKTSLDQVLNGELGWYVPAIPVEDDSTFWGYTSVPSEGVLWYEYLPKHEKESAEDRIARFNKSVGIYYKNTIYCIEKEFLPKEKFLASLNNMIAVCKARGVEIDEYTTRPSL